MTRTAFAAAACAALLIAGPALAQQKPSQATIEAYVKSTFGKASPEWVARITPDESLAVCNATRNNVSSAQSDAIIKRELAKVVYPADGKLLGDWKKGYAVANNGRGGQFSDPPGRWRAATASPAINSIPRRSATGRSAPASPPMARTGNTTPRR